MGCGGSKANGATDTASGGATKSGGKSDETKQLMSEYTLGDVLGQGAFGVVYACAEKGTKDFKYAVKMVDKVETPVAEIKKEAEMMKELEHPNVVKFYAVYYEKCFVCIVMDKYGGGDLIEGMQLHWKTKGKIPPYKVVHIVSGMAKAIDHMHSLQYVHRDVKGDNYLTDRKDITDQGCRVLMSDFGTAVKLTTPQQRLKSSCGTKIYWPPEFYAGNYSFKVDVWAMGVIMYGLCDGRFPFKGEQDAKNKMVKLPSSIPALCVEFVLKCLEKDEKKRFSGADMVAHPWIAKNGDAGKDAKTEPDDPSWTPDAEGIQAGAKGANGAQQERRQELLDRMEQPNKKPATSAAVLWNNRFDVNDKRTGKSLRYEWWPMPQVEEQRVIDLSGATKTVAGSGQASKEDVDTVERMLLDHNIDTNKFGKGEAKTLKHFADEVHSGAAILMLDAAAHKKLVRVVDVVLLRISHNGKFLLESSETFSDGRHRDNLNRLPGTKKEPHENTRKTAARILADALNMSGLEIKFDYDNREVFEEEEESRSFPGVITVYRKEILEGEVTATDVNKLKKYGMADDKGSYSHQNSSKNTKVYTWLGEKECGQKGVKLRAPADGEDVSGLVQAPVGFNMDELVKFLEANKVDHAQFGQNGAKTLKEFSNELIKGEASLMVNSDGKLVRIVDVVLLMINKEGTTDILVEALEKTPDGGSKKLNRLPGTKRRPDENQFVTAQRVLKRQLKMDDNIVNLNATQVEVVEEQMVSASYPGLATLYRKRVIKAELIKIQ
eukprot:TRINITY_DN7992_c0_g1_i5.p1 TRINITY_DN7992_c0_g1~~TRINITY_DN7992_c0_g1_i5.p1  ORF type:complete len:776 (-),score=223.67 TRINITY_DN7992_c0_g1_i5:112-2439(-)